MKVIQGIALTVLLASACPLLAEEQGELYAYGEKQGDADWVREVKAENPYLLEIAHFMVFEDSVLFRDAFTPFLETEATRRELERLRADAELLEVRAGLERGGIASTRDLKVCYHLTKVDQEASPQLVRANELQKDALRLDINLKHTRIDDTGPMEYNLETAVEINEAEKWVTLAVSRSSQTSKDKIRPCQLMIFFRLTNLGALDQ